MVIAVDLLDPCAYEVLCQLRERFGDELPIAVVSAAAHQPRDEVAALLLGADDCLAKPLRSDHFNARVRRLLRRSSASAAPTPSARAGRLTKREREVLRLLVAGVRSAEIAESLCITRKTAATHIEHILAKLGAHSQAQAVAFALRDEALASNGNSGTPR